MRADIRLKQLQDVYWSKLDIEPIKSPELDKLRESGTIAGYSLVNIAFEPDQDSINISETHSLILLFNDGHHIHVDLNIADRPRIELGFVITTST